MKNRLIDLCIHLNLAATSAAALGYVALPTAWLHFVLWSAMGLSLLFALLLVLMVALRLLEGVLRLTESPKERRYWDTREAGEKRFREIFGK